MRKMFDDVIMIQTADALYMATLHNECIRPVGYQTPLFIELLNNYFTT